jgi:hypothetical protein
MILMKKKLTYVLCWYLFQWTFLQGRSPQEHKAYNKSGDIFHIGTDTDLPGGDVLYLCCKWVMSYFFGDKKQINKSSYIQGVSEIGTLILTGNRTRQKEQLFYLLFCRKTMFNSKKKLERFFTKIALRH